MPPIIAQNLIQNIYQREGIADGIDVKNNDNGTLEQKVSFDLTNNQEIININPIQRIYYKEKILRSKKNENGKVAKHDFLILKNSFRGGRGRKIHDSEFEIYSQHKLFDEIQVDAAWGGIIAWRRIGLEYADKSTENNIINNFLIPYLLDVKKLNDEDFTRAMNDLNSLGIKEIDKNLMNHLLPLESVLSMFTSINDKIMEYYRVFYDVDSGEVVFGLSEYIRFYSIISPVYKEFQAVPMFRKIS